MAVYFPPAGALYTCLLTIVVALLQGGRFLCDAAVACHMGSFLRPEPWKTPKEHSHPRLFRRECVGSGFPCGVAQWNCRELVSLAVALEGLRGDVCCLKIKGWSCCEICARSAEGGVAIQSRLGGVPAAG